MAWCWDCGRVEMWCYGLKTADIGGEWEWWWVVVVVEDSVDWEKILADS